MAKGSSSRKRSSSAAGSARKSTSSGRGTSKKNSTGRRGNTANEGLIDEIVLIVVIAFSVLLFLSNLGFIGSFGDFISGILFGLFGIVAYVFPIALVAAAFFFASRKGKSITVKLWAGVLILLIICALAQMCLFPDDISIGSVADYYDKCSGLKKGGGIIGGVISMLLIKGIGVIGSYIVLVVLAVISVILITEKSFIGGVRRGSRTLYDNAVNDLERRRERRENERPLREEQRRLRQEEKENRRLEEEMLRRQKVEERNERLRQRDLERLERKQEEERIRRENLRQKEEGMLRMERKVSGVMLDTKLSEAEALVNQKEFNDDIHELSYDTPNGSYDNDGISTINDKDIREIYPGTGTNVNRLGYENARTSHSISVNTNGAGVRKEVKHAAQVTGNTSELESAIINETLHLGDEYDYEKPVDGYTDYEAAEKKKTADRYDSSRKYEEEPESQEFEYSDTTVDEYMKPTVTVDEGSYESSSSTGTGRKNASQGKSRKPAGVFKFPPVNLLKKGTQNSTGDSKRVLDEKALRLQETLKEFGVGVTMTGYTQGPAITRFEMKPDVGVKVSKVLGLSDDIMLSMAAKNVRIEAPIPGKSLIGIELPNEENTAVMFRDLIDSPEFKKSESKLSFAVGKGLSGETVVADIGKMPHMLIAGATGSGKSVCINTLIMSILYKAKPDEVKLIMVDPKVVELSVYNGIPHLMIPVVTDPRQAAEALKWGVVEMDDRYNKFAEFGVRDLNGYNKKVQSMTGVPEEDRYKVLPRIVIIVDELADLMMVASKEVEESICRIAQKARAAGIHLVIATQRPSVDVVTGLIKANMPSRIAFSVSSGVDSRTILDMVGAEKLLGKGDMLFYPQGYTKPARVQGAFVSDQEVNDVVDFLKEHSGNEGYDEEIADKIKNASSSSGMAADQGGSLPSANGRDELFVEAAKAIIDKNKASIGMLQRLFKIGFNRAARIMDQLADAGVVGEEEGTKPRKVLMSMEQLEAYIEDYL